MSIDDAGPTARRRAEQAAPIEVLRAPDVRTIGVTIMLPEPFRSTLQTLRASYGDPAADTIAPHVTLVPPTDVSTAELDAFVDYIEEVADRHDPFAIKLAGTGSFLPVSPVVFVRLDTGGSQCAALEADLRSGPVTRHLEFDYHPHVTVAHHVSPEALRRAADELAGFSGELVVEEIHLDELAGDERWQPVRIFPLGCGRRGG